MPWPSRALEVQGFFLRSAGPAQTSANRWDAIQSRAMPRSCATTWNDLVCLSSAWTRSAAGTATINFSGIFCWTASTAKQRELHTIAGDYYAQQGLWDKLAAEH